MQTPAREKWRDFSWRRPKDVWSEGEFCLYDKIDVNDIQQGLLGDCYFLSCLSAIAEEPSRIKRIFVTQETNEAGIYAVRLFINGEPRVVVVDDYFPYNEAKGKWAFSRPSSGNEIWVLILEKAWAKVYGSYSRIEVGDCGEAMYPLTGCPTQNVTLKDYKNKENLWKLLQWADRCAFPMCCAANSAEEDAVNHQDIEEKGLVDAHAYTLIKVKEIKLDKGGSERLLCVRNPWGKTKKMSEWNGAWSDSSELWTRYTREQVGLQEANDGVFWISLADFDTFFYLVTICYYREDYEGSTLSDQHEPGSFGLYKFTYTPSEASKTTPITFTIDQANWRFCDKTDEGNEYRAADLYLVVTRLQTETNEDGSKAVVQKYLGGICKANECSLSKPFKQGLPEGEYVVMYKADWASQPMRKLVLSIYDENPLKLTRCNIRNYGQENFDAMLCCLQDEAFDDINQDAQL